MPLSPHQLEHLDEGCSGSLYHFVSLLPGGWGQRVSPTEFCRQLEPFSDTAVRQSGFAEAALSIWWLLALEIVDPQTVAVGERAGVMTEDLMALVADLSGPMHIRVLLDPFRKN